MEATEPIKANRSFTNKLGSKTIRLAFYGMFRKLPSDSTDSMLSMHWLLGVWDVLLHFS